MTNSIIKVAADSLLNRGEITQEEYNSIDFDKIAAPLMDALKKSPRFAKEYMKFVSKDIKSDAFSKAMDDPFLVDVFEKNLTNKNPLNSIGKNFQSLWAIPATIGATVVGKEVIIDPIVQKARTEISYRDMAKHTPQLEGADQEKIRNYFNVIKTYSPSSAANPLVAGALVNKMMEFGGVDHKLIQDMVNIQSGRPSNEAFKTMIGGGLKTLTSPSD